MTNTAPTPSRERLNKLTREYLTLRIRVDKARSRFQFDPEAIEKMTWIRNEIVELQQRERTALAAKEAAAI
jgi:hypothetical protein